LTGSITANTWIRDAIRRSPRARRTSPIRSVTAGSNPAGSIVTRSVSRQMPEIANAQPNTRFLQVTCIQPEREPKVDG
jgi:hypothetical protein